MPAVATTSQILQRKNLAQLIIQKDATQKKEWEKYIKLICVCLCVYVCSCVCIAKVETNYILKGEHVQLKGKEGFFEVLSQRDIWVLCESVCVRVYKLVFDCFVVMRRKTHLASILPTYLHKQSEFGWPTRENIFGLCNTGTQRIMCSCVW